MIENGSSVSIEYVLKLDDGATVDSNVGEDPLIYQQGASQILPALEAALAGHTVGDSMAVVLTAEEGYGAIDPEAYREVALEVVPELPVVVAGPDPADHGQLGAPVLVTRTVFVPDSLYNRRPTDSRPL